MREYHESPDRFVSLLMKIGVKMLASGGEVKRVEDSLERMGSAFGASEISVFVITASIIVTMVMPNGRECTRTRRIHSIGTDFTMLEKMNALSRRFCAGKLSLIELEQELAEAEKTRYDSRLILLGSILAAASFTLFFGGNAPEAFFSALAAVLVYFLQCKLEPLCNNHITFNLFAAFLTGAAICLLCRLPLPLTSGNIMIGVIMLLIPGLAVTNSIRDLLVGDTISGFMRLLESLCWAGALAVGFMTAIFLIGG